MQKSAGEFVKQRTCLSCHHNVLPILTLHMAKDRGFKIDDAVVAAVEDRTFRELRNPDALDDAIQGTTFEDPTPNDSFLLMAAEAAHVETTLPLAVYARHLVGWQRDGHWVTSDFRPPHSSSVFTSTASAIRAIRAYAPPEMKLETDLAIRSARRWLASARPLSTEDASFRLMGLAWSGADAKELTAGQRDLLALALPSGGWPQLRGYDPDAYSTGEALFALHESRYAVEATEWKKGIDFLLSTQAPDGTWQVHTRMLSPASVSPKYFTTGFPYAKDEYLSYAGTSWAVMALMSTIPVAPENNPKVGNDVTASWIRTALFGTSAQLKSLLDSGLDPNSKTANGTTLLMMAAPNVEKVRILIERGANVKARASSDIDALTVAAGYRGTRDAVTELLRAGAEAKTPDDIRVRHTPVGEASRIGDLANVRLLLSHGALAGTEELSDAITFGYPDVVKVLLSFGADPIVTDGAGINLLHWSTITNRASIIPILVKARVAVNEKDKDGFTPLMYAASLDFGETDTLKALLKAGAKGDIPNNEGRTPRQQAQFLHLRNLESALR